MPLPLIHCAVAVRLLERNPGWTADAFLLGSIAPDAIHMRADTDKTAKWGTHLGKEEDDPGHERVLALLASGDDPSFVAGYVAHILTDRLWRGAVYEPFLAAAETGRDAAALRALYYEETDQVDFDLYNRAPWRAVVWERLAVARSVEFPPLLSGDEIGRWRRRCLDWFYGIKQEPGIEPRYITGDIAARFVVEAAARIQALFEGRRSAI